MRTGALVMATCAGLILGAPLAWAYRTPDHRDAVQIRQAAAVGARRLAQRDHAPSRPVRVEAIRVSAVGPWAVAQIQLCPPQENCDVGVSYQGVFRRAHRDWRQVAAGQDGSELCGVPRRDRISLGLPATIGVPCAHARENLASTAAATAVGRGAAARATHPAAAGDIASARTKSLDAPPYYALTIPARSRAQNEDGSGISLAWTGNGKYLDITTILVGQFSRSQTVKAAIAPSWSVDTAHYEGSGTWYLEIKQVGSSSGEHLISYEYLAYKDVAGGVLAVSVPQRGSQTNTGAPPIRGALAAALAFLEGTTGHIYKGSPYGINGGNANCTQDKDVCHRGR